MTYLLNYGIILNVVKKLLKKGMNLIKHLISRTIIYLYSLICLVIIVPNFNLIDEIIPTLGIAAIIYLIATSQITEKTGAKIGMLIGAVAITAFIFSTNLLIMALILIPTIAVQFAFTKFEVSKADRYIYTALAALLGITITSFVNGFFLTIAMVFAMCFGLAYIIKPSNHNLILNIIAAVIGVFIFGFWLYGYLNGYTLELAPTRISTTTGQLVFNFIKNNIITVVLDIVLIFSTTCFETHFRD